ncbi:unnamed protein product, partial [Amoebophrya sp. A120]|eukprot:GSA120T00024085001.1
MWVGDQHQGPHRYASNWSSCGPAAGAPEGGGPLPPNTMLPHQPRDHEQQQGSDQRHVMPFPSVPAPTPARSAAAGASAHRSKQKRARGDPLGRRSQHQRPPAPHEDTTEAEPSGCNPDKQRGNQGGPSCEPDPGSRQRAEKRESGFFPKRHMQRADELACAKRIPLDELVDRAYVLACAAGFHDPSGHVTPGELDSIQLVTVLE